METNRGQFLFVMTGAEAVSGGIAALNQNILRALCELLAGRRELRVFSYLEENEDRPTFLPDSVEFHGFRGNKRALVSALLRSALSRPTMVFDHVTLALPVLPLAGIGLAKTIIFAHGSESWRYIRRTSRWSFSAATLVLTNSHFTLNKMRDRIPSFNGVACPLGLSPRFRLNETLPRSAPSHLEFAAVDGQVRALGDQVLLMVARMHPAEPLKGHYPLLKAWPRVVRDFPDAQLVFAGQGDNKSQLERLARESGAGASVLFASPASTELLAQLYQRCHAFVMPSKQEGFGLVYLEAMNFGKPCVGCFDDGAEDVIVHEETGLLVRDPNDREELASVLRALLADPKRAAEMGAKGFARLHENFTSRHVQERIHRNLEKVLS